ncbi:MAG TPA: hypothetical protein VGB18_04405 [Candidatus Thermoplasmatota archaeon]
MRLVTVMWAVACLLTPAAAAEDGTNSEPTDQSDSEDSTSSEPSPDESQPSEESGQEEPTPAEDEEELPGPCTNGYQPGEPSAVPDGGLNPGTSGVSVWWTTPASTPFNSGSYTYCYLSIPCVNFLEPDQACFNDDEP